MTVYEAKQKDLLVENNELRTSLAHVHRDISKALGLSHHLTSHSAKVPYLLCSKKKNIQHTKKRVKYIIGIINLLYYENLMQNTRKQSNFLLVRSTLL